VAGSFSQVLLNLLFGFHATRNRQNGVRFYDCTSRAIFLASVRKDDYTYIFHRTYGRINEKIDIGFSSSVCPSATSLCVPSLSVAATSACRLCEAGRVGGRQLTVTDATHCDSFVGFTVNM
jgi:hypothetical protein